MSKKLYIVVGIVLIILGGLLFRGSGYQEEEAMLLRLGDIFDERVEASEQAAELAQIMRAGAVICFGAGGVLLIIGYLKRS